MKVFLDTTPLSTGHSTRGIGTYTYGLINALNKTKEVELVKDKKDADIVHYPFFDLFFRTLHIDDRPTVVTIHDVIPLIYPTNYPPGVKGKLNFYLQKREIRKAAAIITDSETSKKDIVRFLDVPQQKIQVIYLAADESYKHLKAGKWTTEIRVKYRLPEKYVLYVGDINYNKNTLNLCRACKKINTPLVIVGKQTASSDFDKSHIENQSLVLLLKEFGQDKNVMRLGFVHKEDLVKIYNLASVYCQASLYEGFGLPVLEAQACGIPVVASKIQCLVEIAADSCLFVNPSSPQKIAQGILRVKQNNLLHKELVQKGFQNVEKYSWSKTATSTLETFRKLV